MSDLISRKALLKELDNGNSKYEIIINIEDDDRAKDVIDKTLRAYRRILKDMINNQPIAYDVDKVVERLQNDCHNYYPSIDYCCMSQKVVKLNDALNIVKGAVKDD